MAPFKEDCVRAYCHNMMFRTTAFKGCAFLVVKRILTVVNGILVIVPEVNGNSRERGAYFKLGVPYLPRLSGHLGSSNI